MMKIISANIFLVNILYTTLHPNRQDYLNKKIQEDIKDLNQNIEVKNMIVDIKKVKIFVTVPLKNVDDVRNAMCEAGAGFIGNYSFCTTSTKSIGTFIPNKNAKPHIGKANRLEYVEEEKLEAVCDLSKVKQVITKIRETHPYEEPAIDIVPLLEENMFNQYNQNLANKTP